MIFGKFIFVFIMSFSDLKEGYIGVFLRFLVVEYICNLENLDVSD